MTPEQQELVEKNVGLIDKMLWKCKIRDHDDFWDIGAIALCQAAIDYDPKKSKQGGFEYYAVYRIGYALNEAIAADRKKRENELTGCFFFSNLSSDMWDGKELPLDPPSNQNVEADVIFKLCTEEIERSLTPAQKEVYDLAKIGVSCSDIARKLGISRQAAHNRLSFVRRKIERVLGK